MWRHVYVNLNFFQCSPTMQYFHPESELAINRLVDQLFTDVECRPYFKKLIKDFAGGDEFGETLTNMVSTVEKHFGTTVFENR